MGAGESARTTGRPRGLARTRLVVALTCLAVLTSSFDVFLTFDVSGFTVRFSQLALLPCVLVGLAGLLRGRRPWPAGGGWLLLWVLVQLAFVFNSANLLNAVGYELWLAFDALAVFGLCGLPEGPGEYGALVRCYLNSFALVALFGLVQFALYPLGVDLLVAQSWTSSLARINGFSYEPSYFATYLLIGFVTHAYLAERGADAPLGRRELGRNLAVILAAMVLSSSRMGWAMVGAWLLLRLARPLLPRLRGPGARLGSLRFPPALALALPLALAAACCAAWHASDLAFLLNGTGLYGTASHSVSDRLAGLGECVDVFLESPLFGVSLGGVDPALAQHVGRGYTAGANGAAMSVLGELLVANGVAGLVPFAAYVASLLGLARKARRRGGNGDLVVAMVLALAFELAVLCFNQNILRPYLWVHIAMLSMCWRFTSNQSETGQSEFDRLKTPPRSCADKVSG